ncbi:hypothetical protein PAMA_004553 [Pampus argenteus]
MYRAPVRYQRSSAAPRPPGRFQSPSSCWRFPGTRSPYGGSPRGCPPYSPGSPVYSPGSNREYGGFGSGGREFREQMRRSGDGFRRPPSCSPNSTSRSQPRSSDSVEKYFSPSMLQDPWAALQPVAAADTSRTS